MKYLNQYKRIFKDKMNTTMKYFLLLLFLNLTFISNCKSQDKLTKYFNTNFDILIHQKDPNTILRELYELLEFYRDTLSISEIWYNDTRLDSGQTPFIRANPLCNVVSNYIKAFYWIWLIYVNSGKDHDIALLIYNDSTIIYDYKIINNSIDNKFLYKREQHIEKLRQSYFHWYLQLKKFGLIYLQKKKISPIQNEYRWTETNAYKWKWIEK
jgi:hypothetical protein